ncbi:rhomboid-domain-containing protein [Daedalea quercina L-15889]|uniref:Rhomboid-domain-containing protein n=1 Tax=Daedalea quercina L-15889 TaxID=1314783 RepID=A0A165MUG1_9APHY|nr:rhomboid-domain-containing protein [Daedalea quercina L-15889]
MSGLSDDLKAMATYCYAQVAQTYLNTTEGKRVCYMLAAANGVVWAVWQVPRMEGFMMRAFSHHPLSGLSYTMLTSTFSHSSFIHLLFNMMALMSFGSSASLYLARQQDADPSNLRESTSKWHFLSFFISAGLFSSLVSHIATARFKYPQLLAQLANPTRSVAPAASVVEGAAAVRSTSALTGSEALASIKPSLGASGAIYAAVTLTAMAFPEAHVSLIFPPTPPIPIQYGVFGFMAMDLVGVIRGWRIFDHHAHLGGAMFGLWYYAYGPRLWESFRELTLGGLPPSLRKA